MKEDGYARWMVERLRLGLSAVGIGAAALVALGGLMGKSRAWTGFEEGGGQGWIDGVKPWALWAFLGGLAVIALLLIGSAWGDGLWLLAGAGAFLLWHAGNEAAEYRDRIEGGILTMYDHHTVSFGLRVVPVVGTIGAIATGTLAALALVSVIVRRFGAASGVRPV